MLKSLTAGLLAALAGLALQPGASAAPLPPLVLAASAAPALVPASGGTVQVTGRVAHASTCRLEVLSHQSFPVVYSQGPRSCASGKFSARVTIGPNPSPVARTVAFALVAANAVGSYPGRFYVRLQAGPSGTGQAGAGSPGAAQPAPQPPVTGQGPPPATEVPGGSVVAGSLYAAQSANWSGYVSQGGPYSEVTGTFTVPSATKPPTGSQFSEWVGLDGTSSSALIQAGVDELPDPSGASGFSLQAWWEVLPAASTPVPSLNVSPGDVVTVSIWKVAAGAWEIQLRDATTGQSYLAPPQDYRGPGASADWVVEAATECTSSCRQSNLAPFSPPVTFSRLGMSGGPETALQQVSMVQAPGTVATPSALSASGFSVGYSGP